MTEALQARGFSKPVVETALPGAATGLTKRAMNTVNGVALCSVVGRPSVAMVPAQTF